MARVCARPNCSNVVTFIRAIGNVTLDLERRPEDDGPHITVHGEICAQCTNDLVDWWLKK